MKYKKGDVVKVVESTQYTDALNGVGEVVGEGELAPDGKHQMSVEVYVKEEDTTWLVTEKDIAGKICSEQHDLIYHDRREEWICPFCDLE